MRALRTLALCLLIVAPATIPYAVHFLAGRDGRQPTGFILLDMPGYMAKARESFDDGFRWTYGNPSNPDPDQPRVYVQPWTLPLGLLIDRAGWDPGAIFLGFGIPACLAFAWAIVRLYREVVGLDGREERLGLVAFSWGGGLLILGGLSLAVASGRPIIWETLLALDPFAGWWFLNLGRNFVLPTEAFYHFLSLSTIVAVLRRRHLATVLLALLTAASHPYTGLELSAILWSWLVVEVVFLRNRERLTGLLAGITGVLVAAVLYYLVFLNRFEAHRQLASQLSLDWSMKAANFVPAYALVGGLALWRLRTADRAALVLAEPRNRLFLVWSLVAFAMANHEFAMAPRQPLHFTRGYIWTPLFLLGAPALVDLFRRLRRLRRPLGGILTAAVLVAFLSDNAVWLLSFPTSYAAGREAVGVRITRGQREVLDALDDDALRGHLLLTEDLRLSYLALAYTPLRSWYGQEFETPSEHDRIRQLRELFAAGRFLPEWERTPVVVVRFARARGLEPDPPPWLVSRGAEPLFSNATYRVDRIPPASARTDDDGS